MRQRLVRRLVCLSLLLAGVVTLAPGRMGQAASMDNVKLWIISPTPGTVITDNVVNVKIGYRGARIDCAGSGHAPIPGVGHWHLFLDGALYDMGCDPTYQMDMQNVLPGRHTIGAVWSENDHMEVPGTFKQVSFVYRPSKPEPFARPDTTLGPPSLRIITPNGAKVSGASFDLKVVIKNYHLSCNLFGKPPLQGWGHWHVNILDSGSQVKAGPMANMSAGSMIDMSCTNYLTIPLTYVTPGLHTLEAVLVTNHHRPLLPRVAATVVVDVVRH